MKLEGLHFYTVELIEAESQAVLNTLTEHDFQDAFKKWQKRWERCIHAEWDYFEGDGGQMAPPVPEIMDTSGIKICERVIVTCSCE
jgi:hypothetical protein